MPTHAYFFARVGLLITNDVVRKEHAFPSLAILLQMMIIKEHQELVHKDKVHTSLLLEIKKSVLVVTYFLELHVEAT